MYGVYILQDMKDNRENIILKVVLYTDNSQHEHDMG